jgi:hypothetical protein
MAAMARVNFCAAPDDFELWSLKLVFACVANLLRFSIDYL